jgi:Fis family transcriptional regulator
MPDRMSKKHIEECVRDSLEGYFKDLRGVEPTAMYDMILGVVEKPLLDVVMKHADGNQSRPPSGWASTATRCAASSSTTS